MVSGDDDDIELSGGKGDDYNGPSGWAQAKGAVAAASSLTIQADKQTVSYWPVRIRPILFTHPHTHHRTRTAIRRHLLY